MTADQSIISLSESLLLAVKMHTDYSDLVDRIAKLLIGDLKATLDTDAKKLVFWINSYNAYFQIIKREGLPENTNIYRTSVIKIAGEMLSLDDIEHGILRKYRYKYSLGYLANPFAPALIRALAVDEIDYRIHFALNCGAESCPPIAFYNLEKIDQQLDLASTAFLESETTIDYDNQVMYVTALFSWFRYDFGGMSGIRLVVSKYLDTDVSDYKIVFTKYSWDEHLDNFA